jgi:hypothetical protein
MDKIVGFQPEFLSSIKSFPRLQILTMVGITDINKQVALIFSTLHCLEDLDIRYLLSIYYYLLSLLIIFSNFIINNKIIM